MSRRPARSTRTDTIFPYTTLLRSTARVGVRQRAFHDPIVRDVARSLYPQERTAAFADLAHRRIKRVGAKLPTDRTSPGRTRLRGPPPRSVRRAQDHRRAQKGNERDARSLLRSTGGDGGRPAHAASASEVKIKIGRASCRERVCQYV